MIWSPGDFGLVYAMWAIMMIAMMLPGATRMILVFHGVCGQRYQGGQAFVRTILFVVAYFLTWIFFSIAVCQ